MTSLPYACFRGRPRPFLLLRLACCPSTCLLACLVSFRPFAYVVLGVLPRI